MPSRGHARLTDAIVAALPGLVGAQPTALPTEPHEPVVTLEPAVPMPEVWIGGTSDAALMRTVAYGQGRLAALITPDELAEGAAKLTAFARERGVPRPQIGTMVFATLTKRQSTGAAGPIVNYLTGAYGVDPSHAAAGTRSPSGWLRMWRRVQATWWWSPLDRTCSPSTTLSRRRARCCLQCDRLEGSVSATTLVPPESETKPSTISSWHRRLLGRTA